MGRRAGTASLAAMSLVVGLMSAFVPTAGAMAYDWSGARAEAAAKSSVAATDTASLSRLIAPRMAPGNPGTPSDPTVVFEEDFEDVAGTAPVLLSDYLDGAYTAAPSWLANCNGMIVNFTIPAQTQGNCAQLTSSASTRQIAHALGQHAGSETPESNNAVTAYTEGNPGANLSQFETVDRIPLTAASGRFLTFSVDSAAKNCGVSAPQYQFSLLGEAGGATPVGGVINACANGQNVQTPPVPGSLGGATVSVGTSTSNGSILFEGASIGVRMTNANGLGAGNDAGFDNIRILDVTPQLDKSFSPAATIVDGVSTLTFTVTNTSELAAKSGWSFTDALPENLVIAPTPNIGGTCDAETTAAAGGTTISVANGSLAAGEVFCTVTVDVTSSVPGSYTNGPANTTETGLNPPADTTVVFFPIDLGDAPASYRTTVADNGARHAVPGYDADSNTAPVMLGESIDVETDGQPSPRADGDDENGAADEDGIAFNPALGYPTPTLRTGLDPISLQPVENTLAVEASSDGFVSVWVDWNQDGVFAEAERMVNAEPVNAGESEVTFRQGTNPAGIETMVRVRYSTDPASIASPTGPAVDGEVEDYGVLIERLVTPDACTTGGAEYFAFTYRDFVNTVVNAGAPGSVTRYEQVSVVEGVPVDMVAEVIAGAMVPGGPTAANGFRIGEAGGIFGPDDARWQIARDATIRYTFVESGTDTPVDVNAVFTVSDMDTDESATFSAADLASYAVTTGSAVQIAENGDDVVFAGDGAWNGDPESRFQFVLEGLNTFDVRWQGFTNSGFGYDGDGDLSIDPPACSDFGDAPDSYGTTLAADGARHLIVPGLTLGDDIDFDTEGQPTDDATGDDENRRADEDGVADPIVVTVGDTTDVTITVTNDTDDVATLAGWIDLNGNGAFEAGELVTATIPAGSGTDAYVLTFPAGTVTADTFARFRLFSGAVAAPLPTGAASAGEVEDYAVTVNDRELDIEKTSDMTEDSRPGDEITYTVTLTNTGSGDYTDEFPAVMFDDLSGVLDDATYNGDATAVASDGSAVDDPSFIPESFLSWAGPIAAGESVTIEYTLTLTGGGDGTVRNVAWQPETPPPPGIPPTEVPTCDPPTDEGTDPVTGEACATTVGELPKLSIAKTSDTVDLPADGGTVTYTVTVTNEGPGDFTADAPAEMTDDLSAVLDDAEFGTITAPASGAAFDADAAEITWSGPLAAGDSIDITYTVTYDSTTGDNVLVNVACVPEDLALDPAADCVLVQVPAAALELAKTVDPEDGSVVVAGQEVTYTLSFTNTGQAPATVDAFDDLSGVLDDATLTAGPTAQDGLTATLDGDRLDIAGEVPVGETLTVTYTVTVNAFADQADHELGNVLSNSDGCPPSGCPSTENPVRHYTVEKGAGGVDMVNPGDVVSYTITIVNDGAADYTTALPASVSDDLAAVLDDATYNGDAVAVVDGDDSIQLPVPTADGTTLDWAGPIAVGQTVIITYSVTINDPRTGDGELTNAVIPNTPGGECAPDECVTVTPVRSYTVEKAASQTIVAPGDTITYTVTVTNTGLVDYTADDPASFEDDLAAVLDDASYNDDATNGAVFEGSTLSWEGALAVGDSITITYSVTVDDPNTGDNILTNAVVPNTPGGICEENCTTTTPVRSYTVTKEASLAIVEPGDTVTYTVTVTNTGGVDYTEDAPAAFTDDLSAVLDDATYNGDATNGATVDGETLTWSGALPVDGEPIVITYSVTVNDPNTGDGELTNAVVPNEPGGSCAPAGSCTTTTDVRSYTVSKDASPETVQPGDTVTYEVTVTNTGNAVYTADAPASFTDDLSEVLDDASYNDDATEGAVVSGSTLSWSGPLAVGESVTITYSVTVNDPNTGDNVLANVVVPTGPGGSCEPDEECSTTTPVQSFRVTKSADAADVVPGDVVTYTLTVVNTGQVPYTAASPASLTDDMTEVLDDATYNDDATNGAVYDEPTLSWEGALDVGESVTITYSVTVNDPASGDSQLDNAVITSNGGNCPPDSDDPACLVRVPSGSYTVAKQASQTTAFPGDVVTYTVTVTNTGEVDYTEDEPASFADSLANVLDDATYNGDASAGATVDGETLSWEGPLAVGEIVTITYSVTVNEAGSGAGDRILANVVTPTSPGGDCNPDEACITTTPIGEFQVSKTSSAAGEVLEGDVVTYTVTVTNSSEVDFTADEPASFTDDLSAVLDDATYNDDASGGATVDGATLSWEGPLAAGESIAITYSVTVGEAGSGDGVLTNGVVPGDGGTCILDCTTTDGLRAYTVAKTSSAGGAVVAGDIVTYTVTVTNTGTVDYTEDRPASFVDDLSAVLDDASYNDDATNGAVVSGSALSWEGPLAAGESVEISYSVTVGAPGAGDGVLTNAVVPTDPSGRCETEDGCTTTNELQAFTVEKSVSATVVYPGDTLTYTITVTNTGATAFTADAPAVITDDLSEVLDDADYNGDATNGAVYTEPELSWALSLESGETVTMTYSVTVHDPSTGDLQLRNAVDPSDGGECVEDGACFTETFVASYAVEKVVDTTSTGEGDTVTYTITVSNTGLVDFTEENPASFTDDLSDVLDDAVYNDDATNGAVYSEPVLSWEGAVEVGGSVTVTYSVTVNTPATGDRELLNAVEPGLGGSCGAACMTTTEITDGLPATGLDPRIVGYGAAAALAAILAGLVLLAIRRRQTVTE